MKKVNFSIQINAPKEKVWHVLFDEQTYSRWTSPFGEGSYVVGDWKEGSKMLFLNSEAKGMTSKIVRHIPNEFLSIQHLGMIDNGVEDFDSEKTKEWSSGLENYTVKENKDITTLSIEMDVTEEYEAYFQETWPKALAKVRELSA